ncbi:MAG: acyltransferase family protein [Bdellovibrionales bacterium]
MAKERQRETRSAHWDFVRGLSMFLMLLINTKAVAGWEPYGLKFIRAGLPLIEPIIFLSGFLICRRLIPIVKAGHPLRSLAVDYVRRRVIRTWPLYFLVVGVVFLFPALADKPLQAPFWRFATFTMNNHLYMDDGLASMWTLCVEEWCYFLLLLTFPFLKFKWRPLIFLSLAFFSLGVRTFMVLNFGPMLFQAYLHSVHFPTWTHADAFWFGCLFADVYRGSERWRAPKWQWLSLGISVSLFLLYWNGLPDEESVARQVLSVPCGILMSATLLWGIEVVPSRWLRLSGLVVFGYASYSFYLIHKPVLALAHRVLREWKVFEPYRYPELLVAYGILILFGTGFFFLLERPILAYLRRGPR